MVFLACSFQRLLDDPRVFPRSEQFKAGHTSHAMAQCTYRPAFDGEFADLEKSDVRQLVLGNLPQQFKGARALNLKYIDLGLATSEGDRFIPFDLNIIMTRLNVELEPITDDRCPSDAVHVVRR